MMGPRFSHGKSRAALALVPALLLGCLFRAQPADAGGSHDRLPLTEVNGRWGGARCRLLFDVPIKKGRDSDGWSKSKWIVPSTGRKVRDGAVGAIFRVSNRDALPDGVVRAGTAFVATGWSADDGLTLELAFEGSHTSARISFHGLAGSDLGLDELHNIESWARLDFFQVSAVDERLVEAPSAPAPPTTAAPPPAANLPGATTVEPSVRLDLRVLGTSTEPLSVAPGQAVALAVTYEVAGVPDGAAVEVTERRTIVRDGRELTRLEATLRRAAGIHRSTQPLTLPADLAPGVLELRVSLLAAGAEASGRALFEVTRR